MVNWTVDHLFVSVRMNEHIGGGCCAGHLMVPLLFANYLFRIIYWQHINLHAVAGESCSLSEIQRGLFRCYFMGGSHNSSQQNDESIDEAEQRSIREERSEIRMFQGWRSLTGIYD